MIESQRSISQRSLNHLNHSGNSLLALIASDVERKRLQVAEVRAENEGSMPTQHALRVSAMGVSCTLNQERLTPVHSATISRHSTSLLEVSIIKYTERYFHQILTALEWVRRERDI